MRRKLAWRTVLSAAALIVAVVLVVRSDLAQVEWTARLTAEGSRPPERDQHSPTGYVLGQRAFLGPHERGETYRWIALTQAWFAAGPFASPVYQADNVPVGRPQLAPKLYAAWLAAISWTLHLVTGDSAALSVERAATWEPVIAQLLVLVGLVAFFWRRYGLAAAAAAALFFALSPPLSAQFLPGVLTSRTWALFLAAYALASSVAGRPRHDGVLNARSALAAALALWLDPAFGFPAVLLPAAAAAGAVAAQRTRLPGLKWAALGASVSLAAWLVDQGPWNPAASELRYNHPLYALAWLGLGLGLDAFQNGIQAVRQRRRLIVETVAAIGLLAPLAYTQVRESYKGWLYSGAAMRRLTSLDETVVYDSAAGWLTQASPAEWVLVVAPALVGIAALLARFWMRTDDKECQPAARVASTVLLVALLALAFLRVKWGVIVSLVGLVFVWELSAPRAVFGRRVALALLGVLLLAAVAREGSLPASLRKSPAPSAPARVDLEALIYRHFAYWLASHHPGQKVTALAPPELSDSLVFHGGSRVLMSTAWESYSGQVAASRVLSALESSEAEAVLQSREVTHLVLPSWDPVLPLLVREPAAEGKEPLYPRLQRWVYPRYLRPIPYHLPPVPGFLDQKLAVFKVTAPQDEALALSRLAEYFAEMDRPEPAGLVAKVLVESFADDPNAAIARALVAAQANNPAALAREVDRLAADVTAGRTASSWDRRVQRAIVLALGHRTELVRAELTACTQLATRDDLFELTPLQAYRLHTLAAHFQLALADEELNRLLLALGAEFSASP